VIDHPAKFSRGILPTAAKLLNGAGLCVLDPMAGTGRAFELGAWGHRVWCVDIEPEYEVLAGEVGSSWTVGDARALPFLADMFDAVVTSPPYGNRMADKLSKDGDRRRTYADYLGRDLSPGNAAAAQWGDEYRRLMREIWVEVDRVVKRSGQVILNCKDHYRSGELQFVTAWHVECLGALGWGVVEAVEVEAPGYGGRANAYPPLPENVISLSKECAK